MRAAYYEEFGASIRIETLPDPEPPTGGVVLRVGANGLCRSDWHGWRGHDPMIALPHVPGHELAGEVEAVGDGVRHWGVGDRVTVPFVGGCGTCEVCRAGDPHVCPDQFQPGFTHWGSCAERVAIRYADANLVRLPENMSCVTAASLGCRFATAFRAVVAQGRAGPGHHVAVFGCGGVGLSAIMIARALGARVIAVDIAEAKLERARDLGAHDAVNAATVEDVPAAIRDLTGGGAHMTLDALGSATVCAQGVRSLRRRGRHVQVGLLVGEEATPPVPMDIVVAWELEILGSHGLQAFAYDDMLRFITAHEIDPMRMVTGTVSLDEAPALIQAMDGYGGEGITIVDTF